jgi:hypothetical protein
LFLLYNYDLNRLPCRLSLEYTEWISLPCNEPYLIMDNVYSSLKCSILACSINTN